MRWQPAIYEHKAALIGRGVAEVAADAELLASALLAEADIYAADILVVGLDIYNVEAEACGATVLPTDSENCPAVELLWDIERLPREWAPPSASSGRMALILEAAARAREALAPSRRGGATPPAIRVAATGPFTLAAKLVGDEPLLLALAEEDPEAERLLDFAEAVNRLWLERIRAAGFDAVLFDSLASPPLLGPARYRETVAPRHKRLFVYLAADGQAERELVMGGHTALIADDLAETGANQLLCDYAEDAAAFAANLSQAAHSTCTIRRNVNPAWLLDDPESLAKHARSFRRDLQGFVHPIAGTGILPYDFPPNRYTAWRDLILSTHA